MLILTRKVGESIQIGDDIRIIVLRKKGSLTLGIEAPHEIPVRRAELLENSRRAEVTHAEPASP